MPANTTKIHIEVEVDGKGGIKVLRQIGTESEKAGKKGKKAFQNMDKSLVGANQRLASTKNMMLKLGVVAGGLVIAREMKKIIDVASDLQETTSKFEVVFAGQIPKAESWSRSLVDAYAMSTRESKQYLSSVQDLLVPMGMQAERASALSFEVVKLSADLGSLNHLPTAQVMDDIQSALVGNYETMKKYGVVLNATTVQQKALAMGLAATKDRLTAAHKAQAAYRLMVEGSQAAVGDMARTSEDYANQVKKLNARLEDLAAQGTRLLPIMSDVVGLTADLVEWVTVLVGGETTLQKHAELTHKLYNAWRNYNVAVKRAAKLGYDNSKVIEIYRNQIDKLSIALGRAAVFLRTPPAAPPPLAIPINLEEQKATEAKALAMSGEYAHEEYKLRMKYHRLTAAEVHEHEEKMMEFRERQAEKQIELLEKQKELEKNWLTGAQDALSEYAKSAADAATNAQWAFQSAMWSMEDALIEMVKTGKFQFSDLADHIIAEMARIVIRQQITGPLASWLGWGLGALFSGGHYAGAGTYGVTPTPATRHVTWHQEGGWIREPVIGRGMRSGRMYGIGEAGPEVVIPEHKIQKSQQTIINQVKVINESGLPFTAKISEPRFDGEKYVTEVHIDKLINNRSYRQANRQAFR